MPNRIGAARRLRNGRRLGQPARGAGSAHKLSTSAGKGINNGCT